MSKTKNLNELVNPIDNSVWHVEDKVVISGRITDTLGQISRITSGRNGTVYVKALNGNAEIAYDSEGNMRSSSSWSVGNIRLATDEDIKSIQASIKKTKLNSFDMKELTDDDAIEIIALIRKKGYEI